MTFSLTLADFATVFGAVWLGAFTAAKFGMWVLAQQIKNIEDSVERAHSAAKIANARMDAHLSGHP